MAQPQLTALGLFSDSKLRPAGDALSRLQAQAVADLQQIQTAERRTAQDALRLGVRLHAVKLALPHGEWGRWQEQHLDGVGRRQVNYYMRLAAVAAPKLGRKALVSIVACQEDADATARLERFVGDSSLTDLLIKHGIRAVGLRSELTAPDPQALPPERQLELAMEKTWEESWSSVERMRDILTNAERAKLLSDPTKLATLKSEIVEINRLLDERLEALRAVTV